MPSPKSIIAATAAVTGVPVTAITGQRRNRRVAWARFLAISAVRKAHPWWTLLETANVFHRDHTSIIWASRRHADLLDAEPSYATQWQELHEVLSTQTSQP